MADETNTCLIDGAGPFPVLRPGNVEELTALVGQSSRDHQALYPTAGRTMLDLGYAPSRPGIAVDLRSLNAVLDYPARDMTITVEAGITLDKLRQVLHTENQRLPVDVSRSSEATLGGALATNTCGSRRLGFGTWRDYVIGISVVNDQGQLFKAGGRVVKNVAGYDLCKLLVGSLGTLGIITQVTLKLKPCAEHQAFVLISCPENQLAELLNLLHGSLTRPVCVDLLNAGAVRYINQQKNISLPEGHWLTAVGFEGTRQAVDWQVEQLGKEIGAPRVTLVLGGHEADPMWGALTEFQLNPQSLLTFKANLLPELISRFCTRAEVLDNEILLQAHAESGIVVGHLNSDLSRKTASLVVAKLAEDAWLGDGNIILPRCPTEWKTDLPVWGKPRGDLDLMRSVKEKFDPHRLFNPGRLVAGI